MDQDALHVKHSIYIYIGLVPKFLGFDKSIKIFIIASK